jgi:hypothetical protein
VTRDLAREERQAILAARYGAPRWADRSAALRLLGLRGQVHPRDVAAFAYRDRAAADAWARSNLDHHGYPSLGTVIAGGEVIGVTDLRPARAEPTDPALPDDWQRAKAAPA